MNKYTYNKTDVNLYVLDQEFTEAGLSAYLSYEGSTLTVEANATENSVDSVVLPHSSTSLSTAKKLKIAEVKINTLKLMERGIDFKSVNLPLTLEYLTIYLAIRQSSRWHFARFTES